jgi:uncharacterized membrane protein YdjX (TVP38/TMEM64 family)
MRHHFRLVLVALVLAALWASFHFSGVSTAEAIGFIREHFEQNAALGLLIFALLFALGNLMHIPGWLFLASAVLALGPYWGGLATYVAACVGCTLSFAFIRLLGADALRRLDKPWAQRLFAQLDERPFRSVLLLRLVFQTVPTLNAALALSGVRFGSYFWATVLGLPVPIALQVAFFHQLAHWLHWDFPAAG